MNNIDFNKATSDLQEEILKEIRPVLINACSHSAVIVGDFVINVMVAREKDPKCKISFNEIEILFDSDHNKQVFINSMNQLKHVVDNQYKLVKINTSIATFVLYGPDYKPYFDVYRLYCMFNKDDTIQWGAMDATTANDVTHLKESIMNNEMKVRPHYEQDVLNSDCLMRQILTKFIYKVWTVKFPTLKITLAPRGYTGDEFKELIAKYRKEQESKIKEEEKAKMLENIATMMKMLTEMQNKLNNEK